MPRGCYWGLGRTKPSEDAALAASCRGSCPAPCLHRWGKRSASSGWRGRHIALQAAGGGALRSQAACRATRASPASIGSVYPSRPNLQARQQEACMRVFGGSMHSGGVAWPAGGQPPHLWPVCSRGGMCSGIIRLIRLPLHRSALSGCGGQGRLHSEPLVPPQIHGACSSCCMPCGVGIFVVPGTVQAHAYKEGQSGVLVPREGT